MNEENKTLLSILIPVRNEPESILIIVKVLEALVEVPHELLIVTDNPTDTTVPVIQSLSQKYKNVNHVQNIMGKGVLNAVRSGIEAARGKYVLIYAADEIGPVLAIPKMLDLMKKGCDFVSGTRYAKGGKRYGGSLIGHLLSRTANAMFNLATATALSDCTTGLKIFRRHLFHKFDFKSAGSGWSFAFDMAIAAQVMGWKIGEVPIVSIDRLFGGASSMRLVPWVRSYISCFLKGLKALPPWHSPKPRLNLLPCQDE